MAGLDDAGAGGPIRGIAEDSNLPWHPREEDWGFLAYPAFRRPLGAEVEFMTVMWFRTQDAVTAFVGEKHDVAYVPESARRVLARFEERVAHYEVRERLEAGGAPFA
jgi:hypothetical protein